MKTLNNNTNKRRYISPAVTRIKLDNEITLALESTPATPGNGDEVYNTPSVYFNNDPFKINLS